MQSFRGAYHTIVLEKVSKKTAFFLSFFAFFYSFFQSMAELFLNRSY